MLKTIAILLLIAVGIFMLGALIRIRIVISRQYGKMTKENFEEQLEDIQIIRKMEELEKKSDLDRLFRLSRNPWGFSKATWCLLKYGGLAVAIVVAICVYMLTQDITYSIIAVIFGFFAYAYPTSHYKGLIEDRERAWNKIQSHIWRVSNSLDTNDSKKVCVEMKDYFTKIGEVELAAGFEAFYELWPDSFEEIPIAQKKFEDYFPFEIPKSLYFILLECWRNASPAGERLENFKKTCKMKYDAFSNELLSNVPTKATTYSLPFLLLSVLVAIGVPAVLNIMEAMNG